MHQTQFSEKNPTQRVFPNPVTFDSSTQYLHCSVPKLKEPDRYLAVLPIVTVAAHELCLKCSSDHGHMGVLHEFAD